MSENFTDEQSLGIVEAIRIQEALRQATEADKVLIEM